MIILPVLRVQVISTIKDDISAIKIDFKRWPSVFFILLFLFPSLKNFLVCEKKEDMRAKPNSGFIITLLFLPRNKETHFLLTVFYLFHCF